jgi:signal transduction histidine kinase
MPTRRKAALRLTPKLTLKDAKSLLHSNLEELAKLTQLSNGLLQLAQIENLDLSFEPVDLQSLITTAVSRVQPLANKKQIALTSTVPENSKINAEPSSLSEALIILLDNAIKYSPEQAKVAIAVKNETRTVVLTVKDSGMGIKASELPHIFDRFYRADSARTKSASNGYGIGLAIAKNIIEQHRGTITAKSAPDVGTTFTIRLPK